MSALPNSLPAASQPMKLQAVPTQPTAADRSSAPAISGPARLVPAVVGPAGCQQTIYVQCYDWCVIDHTDGNVELGDITHSSKADTAQVGSFRDLNVSHTDLMVFIAADPTAEDPRERVPHLAVNTTSDTDAHLTPEMAEELADDLIAFASQLRHKARQVATAYREQVQR